MYIWDMEKVKKTYDTPEKTKAKMRLKKIIESAQEVKPILTKEEAIKQMESEMDLSHPFSGVNKVTANLMLDGIYPAMLINGVTLLVEVLKGFFLDYEKFKTLEDKLPIEVYVRIERFYLKDWTKFEI